MKREIINLHYKPALITKTQFNLRVKYLMMKIYRKIVTLNKAYLKNIKEKLPLKVIMIFKAHH